MNSNEQFKGVELGPLELEEKNLAKEIEDLLLKIMELEQKWLREQNELVRLIKTSQTNSKELRIQKDNFIVLTTKKMRIESKIDAENTTIKNLNKNLDNLRLQSEKLNKYIFKENETKISMEKQFELTTNDFIDNLKQAEIETNKMQNRLDEIKIEKEKLLRDLIETE